MLTIYARRPVTITIEPSRLYDPPRGNGFESEEEIDAAVDDVIAWIRRKFRRAPSQQSPPQQSPKKTRHPYRDPPDIPLPPSRSSAPAPPPPDPSERKAAALKELDQAEKRLTIAQALWAANPNNPNYLREYMSARDRFEKAQKKLR
jgi:hypothetical protein